MQADCPRLTLGPQAQTPVGGLCYVQSRVQWHRIVASNLIAPGTILALAWGPVKYIRG